MSTITMIHGDCERYMDGLEENAFDLAIVDPPYGIGMTANRGQRKNTGKKRVIKHWDTERPPKKYFNKILKISNNQIIWGGNYFELPPTRCFVIWDKMTSPDFSFAMCELAWTSFDKVAKIFRKTISVESQKRFHPTQKPVQLYKWLLQNYAKENDTIFDSHGGSGSICIACIDLGFDLVWIEKDKDYYNSAVARVKKHNAQLDMFVPQATIITKEA